MLPVDQLLLIAIILLSTALYVTSWLPTEITALGTIVALMATGLLEPGDALSGFSSTATITVGAMFILSAGLMRTGALEMITLYLGRFAQGSARRLLLLLALVEIPVSAFMNNTPVVVMMIPVVVSLCRQYNLRPSKFLLPVSYFAVLGGTVTLLGTSTNILVSDLYHKAGGSGLGLFDFTALGLVYAAVGGGFLVLFGHRLLPNDSPLATLTHLHTHATYLTEMVVAAESKVNGRQVTAVFEQIALHSRSHTPLRRHRRLHSGEPRPPQPPPASVTLLEVLRDGQRYQAEPLQKLILQPADILLVSGPPKDLLLLQQTHQLSLATVFEDTLKAGNLDLKEQVMEAVIMPGSEIVGNSLKQLQLHSRFGVKIMGIQHQGSQQMQGLRDQRLIVGDVLLLQGETVNLRTAAASCRMLLVEGVEESLIRKTKNTTALLIMGLVVALATFTEIPIVTLSLAGAMTLMLTRCLRVDEAAASLEVPTLMLLAGTIPIGLAMESTGLVQTLVDSLVSVVGLSNPHLFLVVFYILTALLTELLSNNAVAVLLTPVALSLAATLAVDPMPLLVAVIFGASASFMTPFGYQTNAIVMGPGGYKFVDYLRIGLPLQLLMVLIASSLIPVLWPL